MYKARGFRAAALAVLVLGSINLTGCVVAPARGYYVDGPVMVAPPPARVEVIGVAPAPGLVWIGGYWNWVGGNHVWVGGHWEAPPPGYHAWVAHRWVPYRGGWRLAPGHWR
jgi:hypothetical protein